MGSLIEYKKALDREGLIEGKDYVIVNGEVRYMIDAETAKKAAEIVNYIDNLDLDKLLDEFEREAKSKVEK